ncbi:MAG: DUF2442 domain-containing protein [Bacteroidota bacterium]
MNTSKNKKADIESKDPLDKLIFEKGLRIKNVIIDKELDLIGIILNTGKILETKISIYPRLKNATEKDLQKWNLTGKGVGISWENLNEDLSVKGFIQTVAINDMLEHLEASVISPRASA